MRADQKVTMTYDSLMPQAALYRAWMREQVEGISESVEDTDIELLIGIWVSDEKTAIHHPSAENLANGLAGICAALKDGSHSTSGGAASANRFPMLPLEEDARLNDMPLRENWIERPLQAEPGRRGHPGHPPRP